MVKFKQIRIPGWLTYSQAANRTKLSISSVRVYAARAVFERAYVHGEFPLISESSVQNYLETRAPVGKPKKSRKKEPSK
jgi:hypothetical protein